MSAMDVFLGTVVPILGGIIAIVMYCSPVRAVYTARQQGSLGDLNPLPFAVTFVNTACWNAYGLASADYNMFLPNIPGVVSGLYTSITSYGLASRKTQDMILSIICSASVIVLVLGVITRFVCTAQQGKLLWGILCNIITIAYYGAPLSSAYQVVRSRNSASIYLPTCIANLVNATLWVAYGFAVGDYFIWLPNGIGGIFAVLLTALCFIYPKKTAQSLPDSGATLKNPSMRNLGGMKHVDSRSELLNADQMEEGNGYSKDASVGLAQVQIIASGGTPKGAKDTEHVLKADDSLLSPRYAADGGYGAAGGLGRRTKSRALDS